MSVHRMNQNRLTRQMSIGEQVKSEQVYKTGECRADYYRYYTEGYDLKRYVKSRFDEKDSKMDPDNRVELIKNYLNLKLDMPDK